MAIRTARLESNEETRVFYRAWKQIKKRCYSLKYEQRNYYGGRGIKMSPEWKASAVVFCSELLAEIGPRPSPEYSVDRINNDGNYEPGNLRWATPIQQQNNTRQCSYIEHEGKRQSLSAWSRETGIAVTTIRRRLRIGLSIDKVFLRQPEVYGSKDLGESTIRWRIKAGWDANVARTSPRRSSNVNPGAIR